MTNDECIEILHDIQTDVVYGLLNEEKEAIDKAIEVLKSQPCEDCISRQYLIERATSWDKHFADSERCVSLTDIQGAPSVTPQPKIGKWIVHPKGIGAHLVCNKCLSNAPYDCKTNYCPKCGAKMEVDK